jgi:long-chain acyl-CoA synthetase
VNGPQPLRTINDIFRNVVERDQPCAAQIKRNGVWVPFSSREMCERVAATAQQLLFWGVKKGDRVALLSENRPEWAITDFACLTIGAVDVPIYATLTPEQTAFILRDSGARIIFVSTADQYEKIKALQAKFPDIQLERIVVMDDLDEPDAVRMSSFSGGLDVNALAKMGEGITPQDLATIIYTSGTTGTPKGVMLTHDNLVSNLETSLHLFEWSAGDSFISFLPLSHITARHVDYACWKYGTIIAYCPFFDRLGEVMREFQPTIFVSVPRVYEKIYNAVKGGSARGPKSVIYNWAMKVGREHVNEVLAGKTPAALSWKLADRIVYRKVRAAFGGRVRHFISGGAPLGIDLARWYACVGIRIYEGYGLTETSPVIAVNTPQAHRLGTIGKALPNVECRVAEDGELQVRGPSVFKQYWNLPEETAKAFTPDGWFKTGDIATIDADGFLTITDRKKDLIKTSGGKFIAPQPIESALKQNVLVAYAAVIGEKRNFPSVILAPHFPLLESWAHANDVTWQTHADLIAHPKIKALYEGIVTDVNSRLAKFEKLKKVLLVPDEFTIESGELTPSMKLKRRIVEEKYKKQIDALYADTRSTIAAEAIVVA